MRYYVLSVFKGILFGGNPPPPVDPNHLYCGRVRVSRLGHWTNAQSEEIDFNRVEFCMSLGAFDAHQAKWRMQTGCSLITDCVKREYFVLFYNGVK